MILKKPHILFILLGLMMLFSSCQRNECIQKSKVKAKKYRLKKVKAYQRGVGGGTATTVGAMEELKAKKEQQKIEEQQAKIPDTTTKEEEEATQEIAQQPTEKTANKPSTREDIFSIPDSKFGGPPPAEKKIEFQGQDIDLAEGEFLYEEQIAFVSQTDLFSDPATAREQLKELTELLKNNRDINVTIIGNTASTVPEEDTIYGDSPQALNQETILNTRDATIKDSMLARAKRVYDLLVGSGVNPDQLDYATGSHRRYKRDRVVTFIIK